MKKLRPHLKISRKIVFIVASVVILAGVGTGGYLWFRSQNSPEAKLFRMLSKEQPRNLEITERGEDGDANVEAVGIVSKDGTVKAKLTYTCTADLPGGGKGTFNAEMRYLQEKIFVRYATLAISDAPDKAEELAANDLLAKLTDKWILFDDREPIAATYKETGIMFGTTGAYAKDQSAREVAALLRKHRVLTVTEVTLENYNNRRVDEYHVSINKEAYGRFMDELHADLRFREAILDQLFEHATEDVRIAIYQDTSELAYEKSEIDHPCRDIASLVDPEFEKLFPRTMEITTTNKEGNTGRELTEPADYINTFEYLNLISETILQPAGEEQ